MRAGPSGAGTTLRRRAVIDDSDDEFDAVSSERTRPEAKRRRLTTDRGYDSMDDEEENRLIAQACAASLETENAELRAQVARLQEKLEETTEQRDNARNAAEDNRHRYRQEHGERVKLHQEMNQLVQEMDERDSTIAHLNGMLRREYKKNGELERQLRAPPAPTGIAGICNCLFFAVNRFDSAPDGTIYARAAERPLGCHRYDVLNVLGKYDDGDAWWHVGTGAWTVAYHGTTLASAQQIVRNGFHMSKAQRAAYGHGIYCSPDADTARAFAKPFMHQGSGYRAVLQCFVDPREKQLGKPANDAVRADGEYWVMPGGYAIRPYAVCLFAEP